MSTAAHVVLCVRKSYVAILRKMIVMVQSTVYVAPDIAE